MESHEDFFQGRNPKARLETKFYSPSEVTPATYGLTTVGSQSVSHSTATQPHALAPSARQTPNLPHNGSQ